MICHLKKMKIKILSFSSEIDHLKNNNIFCQKISQKYPGTLWVNFLKRRCPFNFEFQTADKTLTLINEGKVDPASVAVFQHNLDEEAIQLINQGAIPFLLSMYESPLYCGEFYDSIASHARKFHHVKIFGANLYKIENLSQAYFPSFSRNKLEPIKQISSWNERRFGSMVMGNKYVLSRPFYTYKNWQGWCWWLLKFLRQSLKGPKLPKSIDISKIQLQDMRYEVLLEMLRRNLIDLYGNGWDKLIRIPPDIAMKLSKLIPKNGVSSIEDKCKIISNYKFNICFENVAYPGYITEKIFDAFLAKTIPVYFGAPDISNFIPLNSYIDASKFSSVNDLVNYIVEIDQIEAETLIQNGQKFLQSSKALKFSYEGIADEIIQMLEHFFVH